MLDVIVVLRISVREGMNERDVAGCIRWTNNTHSHCLPDLLQLPGLSIGTNMAVLTFH
jgi:hypothetical protein